MNKIYLMIFLSAYLNLCAQKSTRTSGKLDSLDIKYLHDNYNWNKENILIINFLQPRKYCHYDTYDNLSAPSKWWTNFYSRVNTIDVANRFAYSDSRAESIIDFKTYFPDMDSKLLYLFFKKFPYCHGVVVINQLGYFAVKGSEYSEHDVNVYIEILRIR